MRAAQISLRSLSVLPANNKILQKYRANRERTADLGVSKVASKAVWDALLGMILVGYKLVVWVKHIAQNGLQRGFCYTANL